MPPLHAALVGRARELSVLAGRLGAAQHGQPSLVVLRGDAGIGKSRLVEEFADLARAGGALVAAGFCVQSGTTSLPYAPFLDVVAELNRQVDDLGELLPAQLRRSIAPLLGDVVPAPGISLGGLDLALPRMFAGLSETISIVSRRQPVVVVVEDVHWADESSLDLIDFLARRFGDQRVVMVATQRTSDRRPSPTARSVLSELVRLPHTVELALGPLDRGGIDDLLAGLPNAPSAVAAERIRELSEGNPFFALHLAAHGESGELLSPALRDSLLPLDETDGPTRDVLFLLAVLGRFVPGELLEQALDWTADDLTGRLRQLVGIGLAQVRGELVGLRHALVREALLDVVLPTERVLAHFRAASALLRRGAADEAERAGELALHLLGCGRNAEAMGFALRGARHSASVWAFADACRLYESVIRLWPVVDPADPARDHLPPLVDILAEHATATRWDGELDAALAILDRADALPALDDAQQARLAYTRGLVLWAAGDVAASLLAYTTANRLLDSASLDEPLRVAALAALAGAHMMSGQATSARTHAERAIELARDAKLVREELHATITLAAALGQQGEQTRAIALLERCLPVARQRDELDLVVRCYGNLTFVLHNAGRYEDVERIASEGEEVCRRYGPVLSVASTIINNHVSALISLGRWDSARQLGLAALEEVMPAGIALSLHQTLAEVAAMQGADADVDHHLAKAADLNANNPYARSSELTARAERLLWAGAAPEALQLAQTSLLALGEQDDAILVLNACWLGLRAAADAATTATRRGDMVPAPALDLLQLAHRTADGSPIAALSATLRLCDAEARRMHGEDTEGDWSAAAAANDEISRRYHYAYALYRLAMCQVRRRALQAVVPTLREARDAARALGCRPLARGIDELAGLARIDLGPDVATAIDDSPRTPATALLADPVVNAFGLTRRELEVLALISSGATNRGIARTLFISERTAGVHVGNILAKLQVSNRTAAALAAHQLGIGATDPTTARDAASRAESERAL